MAAKISSFSDFGDNYRYLSYKYGIGIHVWHSPLCKLYKCFDLFLRNHHKTIANGVFIRDLCLLRENNIVYDGQDLTSTELTYMIDFLCLRNIIGSGYSMTQSSQKKSKSNTWEASYQTIILIM